MAVEPESRHKKARTRSPAYPYIALPEALEKASQLWRAEGRHAVSVNVAMQHWGYKAESSTGFSCIAALKKFSLVDEEGVGENREVRLSNLGLAILLDEAGSPERGEALRTAALGPRIHSELWERYGPDLPSDQSLKRFLVIEKNFNETAVEEFVGEYRETIAYAGLTTSNAEPGGVAAQPLTRIASGAPASTSRPESSAEPGRDRARERNGQEGNKAWQPAKTTVSTTVGAAARQPSLPFAELTAPGAPQELGVERDGGRRVDFPISAASVDPPKELPVPLDNDLVARVPYPMTEEDFTLLIATLQLWKKRLVRPKD